MKTNKSRTAKVKSSFTLLEKYSMLCIRGGGDTDPVPPVLPPPVPVPPPKG